MVAGNKQDGIFQKTKGKSIQGRYKKIQSIQEVKHRDHLS